MTIKRILSGVLTTALVAGLLSGCEHGVPAFGQEETGVTISVGNWPDEKGVDRLRMYEDYVQRMKVQYPEIKVIPDIYRYDIQTYTAKAASNQMPTIFTTWFTEIKKIIDAGYAADITDAMHKYGYDKALNPELLELVSQKGRIYAIPMDTYAQGLFINKNLFKRAGLMNADGSIKIPDTYEEMAEMAQIINEKTGRAGFVLPATGNNGGWHFMNIAWSFGVTFIKQDGDGRWRAVFNTPECVSALEYVKDLKWKYNAVPENVFIDKVEMMKLFATDQAAMCFLDPPSNRLVSDYGMNKDNLMVVRMPKGTKGRYSQMGGNVQMISSNATKEQIDAIFHWLEITGSAPDISDGALQTMRLTLEAEKRKNSVVLDQIPFKIWIDNKRNEKVLKLRKEYCNIDPKDFESYYAFEDVIISPETEVCAQELYAILDACIQEVMTDRNADTAALVEKAQNDFQVNYLDKLAP